MSIRFGRSGNGYDSSEVMETEDDDWRKVTDLNERRKIQNRLAQRNYRRKLRQRLEQLERQAGENTGVTSTPNAEPAKATSKRRKRQSSAEASSTSSRTERKDGGKITRKVSNLEDRSSTRSPMLSNVVPVESSNSRAAEPVSRNLYNGDFGPLFTGADARQQSVRQLPDQQLSVWAPQPYSQQQQQQQQQVYGQHLVPQTYYNTSPPSNFSMSPTSHTVNSEPPASPSQQIQAYLSLLPNDPVSSPLTHRGEASPPNTHTTYSPNARPNNNDIEVAGFPDLSPTYSANPITNPHPYHLNGSPLPTDNFYLTLNYATLFNASMEVAKKLHISGEDLINDDSISPFNRDRSSSPFQLSEDLDDLEPTKKQLEMIHHPHIDIVPFKGFRDRLLDYVKCAEEKGDFDQETKVCTGMYESWGVWGQVPWEARSWEIGEAFARKYWFLMDEETIKYSNWWRRQRGLNPLRLQELREAGRVIGEVE